MAIYNIYSLCLNSFVDTALQCIGQPDKFKASDEGTALLGNSTFLYFKNGISTLEKNLILDEVKI